MRAPFDPKTIYTELENLKSFEDKRDYINAVFLATDEYYAGKNFDGKEYPFHVVILRAKLKTILLTIEKYLATKSIDQQGREPELTRAQIIKLPRLRKGILKETVLECFNHPKKYCFVTTHHSEIAEQLLQELKEKYDIPPEKEKTYVRTMAKYMREDKETAKKIKIFSKSIAK